MGDSDGVALLQKLQLSVAEKDEMLTEKGACLSLRKNKAALEEGGRPVQ
jgi:hypothetical protein